MTTNAAILPILLQSTGLSQAEAARFCGVQDRGFRRWITGERSTPDDAIQRLIGLSRLEDKFSLTALFEHAIDGRTIRLVLVYLKDADVPAWDHMPTASAQRAVVRRAFERHPSTTVAVTFDRHAYRAWARKACRSDSHHERHLWALSVIKKLVTAPSPSQPELQSYLG